MDWIPIANLSPRSERRDSQGVRVDLLVSPYDVPEALRGEYLREKGHFRIEFKYISTEDTSEKPEPDMENVTVRLGRNSGRLYAIELDVQALQATSVELRIKIAAELKNVLTHLIDKPLSPLRSSNYSMAKEAIEKHEQEILQAV
jgi:hypothetical protein